MLKMSISFFNLLNSSYILRLPIVQSLQTKAEFTNEGALSFFRGRIKNFKEATTCSMTDWMCTCRLV